MTFSSRILFSAWMAGAALATVSGAQFSLAAVAQEPETTTASPLTVVDPYLLKIPANGALTASAVVTAAAGGKATAKGIVADGTSAAIAVFKTSSSKSVTFSATNGGKVAAYAANFLTTVGAMTSKVVVTPAKIGSSYYALALVASGVAPDAEHGVDTVVHAQSAGSTAIVSYSLATLPTPVVLVHGLWGDQTSLASTESYLKANSSFKANPSLVTAICYSTYLNFDAATDTLPGHGTGCEMTSAQALSQYLSTALYKELDKNQWVGGRVDAVAHSMGGLAARHFTAVSGYKSTRNRMLGAFRNVITLDTPETGSALATYLDDTGYKRKLESTQEPDLELWQGFCGSSTATVETCFDANGLPLSYPGTALSTGAVASLIPGGHNITSAPAADIFNTSYGKWYSIASDYKDGEFPPALLRDVLNTVIAATYASGQTAPTLTSILGTPDSDVIVSVPSQSATAIAAETKEFKNLQHTAAPSEAEFIFVLDDNPSVADSAEVNGQVAYWLGLQSTPAAAKTGAVRFGQPQQMNAESAVRPRFLAPERLNAYVPQGPVALGRTLSIPLSFRGGKVAGVWAIQRSATTGHEFKNVFNDEEAVTGRARIVSQDASRVTIEVTPLQLGPLRLKIAVLFADGGLAVETYQLNAAPSASGAKSFELNGGFKSLALVLEDKEEDRQTFLTPQVEFDGLLYPVKLDGSDRLNVSVDQPLETPVIRVDAKGLVHALRPGTAVIIADFDGVKDSVTVDVYSKEDAPAGYRRGGEE